MQQLGLQIIPRLPYSPENFLVHAGIQDELARCLKFLDGEAAYLCFFVGEKRSGKTHLAVRIADEAERRGFSATLFGGEVFEQQMTLPRSDGAGPGNLYIVDDADQYLEQVRPGQSGQFVDFAEKVRQRGDKLILMLDRPVQDFSFDEHIQSRMKAGVGLSIGAPSEQDLPELLRLMAKQRGKRLKQRKIDYLCRRLSRAFEEIEAYLNLA